MDDGELDFSNQQVFSSPNMVEIPSSSYLDSLCNEFLKDTYACTHTHTCNPPGPDFSHTHTCYHVHTKIVPAPAEDQVATDDTAESAEKKSKKRPLGNKEAVRKYREKKKANAASLEDEVVKLRALNQHLMKKLQAQAPLEAEIARLKCLLVDIRGRIEGEIGSFPYQKSPNSANPPMANLPGSYVMNPCNMQCDDRVYCLHPEGKTVEEASLNGEGFGGCEFESLQCLASQNLGAKDLPTCGVEQTVANVNSSASNKRKDCVSKNQTLIDGYLEVYEGLCGVKKVCLSGQILAGSSIRSILVREAKNHAALPLVVGGRAATAKYCAKRLPPTTNVLAIRDSRIVFRRCTNQQLPVAAGSLIVDPRPSLTVTENLGDEEIQSEFGGSVLEIEKSTRENTLDLKDEAFNGSERCKSRSKSMFAGDPVEQKLGWPLLRRASSGMSQTLHARDMSVVQWVMTLPDRSPHRSPHFSSIEENPFQRAISDIKDDSSTSSSPQSVLLPEGLEMFNVNSLNCNWFSLEVLKSCTNQFSSENLIGKGGSNRVYKGVLPDGKPIAVKVMQSSKEAWKGFELEVEIISSLKHKSITPLLGI